MRIGLPSGVIELALEDSGRPVKVQESVTAVDNTEEAPAPSHEFTLIRRVDPKILGEQLRSAVKTDEVRSTRSIETALRLAPIVDMPSGSKLVAINDRPVTSVDAAVARLEQSLARNIAATLTLADGSGGPVTRVYLLPQPE